MKSDYYWLLFQIKEITFLKNTVMECEACGEFVLFTCCPVDSRRQ